MKTALRTAALAAAMVLLASCTRYADDARAVAGPDLLEAAGSGASECSTVDAELTTVPAVDDGDPVLKIPQPDGWERSTMMDSNLIRFAMANRSLAVDNFAPTAVVTLESAPGEEDPDVVFDSQRASLESQLGVTGVEVTEHTLCGLPAKVMHYEMPVMGTVAPHPAMVLFAVMHTDDTTYAVAVTVQTTDPDNPTYKRDSDTILNGFQMLPPSKS
ncbi:LpqN/LpqT family lipoprotein [Mycobacterium sp. 21AC1]|uniref:LpqN/LpqT family lipoprotein n=1 Tax=[Mycobacterium] appelbergii TaxID=2939269 RepID=UPI002938D5E5|nr:LpqN/LpqT family lipoprotein [Mycobacterium sp. 21AC1]MDV3128926.1 LpqN/LpqT family lipoprotein [Mycobacterium sp. 21AC1]